VKLPLLRDFTQKKETVQMTRVNRFAQLDWMTSLYARFSMLRDSFPPLLFGASIVVAVWFSPHQAVGQSSHSIQGRLTGQLDAEPISLADFRFRVHYQASGVAKGAGRVAVDFVTPDVIVDPVGRQIQVQSPPWTVELVTANGDKIVGLYEFQPSTFTYNLLGFFVAITKVEVTGGTGRFAGASGSGKTIGLGNLYTGQFVLWVDVRLTR
jgi:hypothetical protein